MGGKVSLNTPRGDSAGDHSPSRRNPQLVRNMRSVIIIGVVLTAASAAAQEKAPQPTSVVRRIIMNDGLAAQRFAARLEELKKQGLFRRLVSPDPKKPAYREISFLPSGNYLLVVGDGDWVEHELGSLRLMAFLFERPRAHLQLNLRVVQLTGPANADVIQMTETVRALVNGQRSEVVRAFSDLQN